MLQLHYWADLKVIYLHCTHGESFLICYILFTAHILHLAANYLCTSNYNTIGQIRITSSRIIGRVSSRLLLCIIH